MLVGRVGRRGLGGSDAGVLRRRRYCRHCDDTGQRQQESPGGERSVHPGNSVPLKGFFNLRPVPATIAAALPGGPLVMRTFIALLVVVASLALLSEPAGAQEAAAGAKKKIVLLAGRKRHAFGDHEHFAGCTLLAKRLNEVPGVEAVVVKDGWPKDESVLEGAAAIVMFSDGGGGHFAITKIKDI